MPVYFTHDNGGRPFKVFIVDSKVNVYALDVNKMLQDIDNQILDDTDEEILDSQGYYNKHILHLPKYKRLLLGENRVHNYTTGPYNDVGPEDDGNSMLIDTSANGIHQYIYIGETVSVLEPEDEILEYHSSIGNNDVPYPYAVGTKNTYLMIEEVLIPNKDRIRSLDPYDQYYDTKENRKYDQYNRNIKKFTMQTLFPRNI